MYRNHFNGEISLNVSFEFKKCESQQGDSKQQKFLKRHSY
jgi:hypothetical protein